MINQPSAEKKLKKRAKRRITQNQAQKVRDELIPMILKARDLAGRCELFATMHELDKAVKRVGYEYAEVAPW